MRKKSQNVVAWRVAMRNNEEAVGQRLLILGAFLDDEQNLTILRKWFDGATPENNICLIIHQQDTVNNPSVLVLKNDGVGDLIQTQTGARLSVSGIWQDAGRPKGQTLTTDAAILKALTVIEVYASEYVNDEVHFAPDASDFAQAVGFGDGKSLSPLSVASFALKAAKCLFDVLNKFIIETNKRLLALEKREKP